MEKSPARRGFYSALRRRQSELFAVFGDLKDLNALSNFEIIMRRPLDASFEALCCSGAHYYSSWRRASAPSLSVTVVCRWSTPPERPGNRRFGKRRSSLVMTIFQEKARLPSGHVPRRHRAGEISRWPAPLTARISSPYGLGRLMTGMGR